MIFLEVIWLGGLLGIVVPIWLHLQRRKTPIKDWAAMRFLQQAVTQRRRGLRLEQYLLLLCRCLVIVAFVLALAQPWTAGRPSLGPGAAVVCLVLGLSLAVWASLAHRGSWFRWGTFAIGCTLCGLAGLWALQSKDDVSFGGQEPRDVVLIIDGSDSMGLRVSQGAGAVTEVTNNIGLEVGSTAFAAAKAAAEQFLERLPPGSMAAVLFADGRGPATEVRIQTNLAAVRRQLAEARFFGGRSQWSQVIEQAKELLRQGKHAQQQIVLLGDDQWTQWQSLADLERVDVDAAVPGPRIYGRFWTLPAERRNLAITALEVNDSQLRTGHAAMVRIEVMNGGLSRSNRVLLEILMDDAVVEQQEVDGLEPGVRQVVTVEVPCEEAGGHVIRARLRRTETGQHRVSSDPKVDSGDPGDLDDLPSDDQWDRAIAVRGPAKVLIVEPGSFGKGRSQESVADYVQLALQGKYTAAKRVQVAELTPDFEFDKYEAVVLADVPMLPSTVAGPLAAHVAGGAGLLLLLGENCDPAFYNQWSWEEKAVLPVVLKGWEAGPTEVEGGVSLDVAMIQHNLLSEWVRSGEHDLWDWRSQKVWTVGPLLDTSLDDSALVRLTTGQPLLFQREFGRGRMLIQTSAPLPRNNNFINRVGFPVWLHLLVRNLSEGDAIRLNQGTQRPWNVRLPGDGLATEDVAKTGTQVVAESLVLRLVDPAGVDRLVTARPDGGDWSVDLGWAQSPGLHRLEGELKTGVGPGHWPLTVERDSRESDLTAITDEQRQIIEQRIGMMSLIDDEQWKQVAATATIGQAWWRLLGLLAVVLLVTESLLLLWIRVTRSSEPVVTTLSRIVIRPSLLGTLPLLWGVSYFGWTRIWRSIARYAEAEFSVSLDSLGVWVATLSCLVVLIQGGGTAPGRHVLGLASLVLRCGLLGLLGFVLAEPQRHWSEEREELRRVVVLWDQSDSMQLPAADRSLPDSSRQEVVQRLLEVGSDGRPALLERLQQDFELRLYGFAATGKAMQSNGRNRSARVDLPTTDKERDVTANSTWATTTDLSAALGRVLTEVPLEELAGVVVLSDGCDRSELPPSEIAEPLFQRRIPLHSVIIGDQTPIVDAVVAAVQAPSQLFLGDQVTLRTSLKFDQLAGQIAKVRLWRNDLLIDTQEFVVSGIQFNRSLNFIDEPSEIGLHKYRVEIETMVGEKTIENNSRDIGVWVTDDRVKLLLVEQRPRWEYRYLKNLFAGRDRNVALQHVLLSPDRLGGVPDPFPLPASAGRAFDDCEANRLPINEQEWLKFDVIVLGDVDPTELDVVTQKTLDKFVRQRGGTLIVMAGPQSMPHRYFDQPLAGLLPVLPSQKSNGPPVAGYRLRLTDDGQRSPFCQGAHAEFKENGDDGNLEGGPEKLLLQEAWNRLPVLEWRHPAAQAKPGAIVWAWAERDGSEAGELAPREHVLAAWQRYGGGRVLQFNFDQTWRLRFWNGDALHHQFWGRVMRWSTAERLGIGNDVVRVGLDKTAYEAGETVLAKLRWVDGTMDAAAARDSRLVLLRDETVVTEHRLTEVADSGGLWQSEIKLPEVPGRYRLRVTSPALTRNSTDAVGVEDGVWVDFFVSGETTLGESSDWVAQTTVATALAAKSGGKVLVPETAHHLLDALGPGTSYHGETHESPLWNTWPVGLVFFGLLFGDWILRRRMGWV